VTSHRLRRLALSILALVALSVAAAGCSASIGSKKTLKTDQAETQIAESLNVEATVSCPEDVEVEEGGTFDCDVETADGETGVAHVTQKDDEGNIRWTVE